MKYPYFKKRITGVVIPVSALKSRDSLGIGEFADLPLLGRWAASVGLKLIQILPVNDTGYEHSPYSALSAFALHPVYARLQDFPEAVNGKAAPEIQEEISRLRSRLKEEHPNAGGDAGGKYGSDDSAKSNQASSTGILPGNINFDAVLSGKMHILKAMWETVSPVDMKKAEKWAAENPWVRNYALFSLLKEENELKSWLEWEEYRNPGEKKLEKLWKKKKKDAFFRVWLQWRLEEQFISAAKELDSAGIALKGDIPILINEDSADVWAEPSNFDRNYNAGSPDGQNWGFPVYNWESLRRDNFRWWKNRLKQASKFYHALRIDHVLGFFRIWAVPAGDYSARNGFFLPCEAVSRENLVQLGFDDGRINWLSRAHFPGEEIREMFPDEEDIVKGMLEKIGSEDLWRARLDGPNEKEVASSSLSPVAREKLNQALGNRTLLSIGPDSWTPSQNYENTRGWLSLSEDERRKLGKLLTIKLNISERIWERTGRELLNMMKTDGSMLVCAEDLGAIPPSVPLVLKYLKILGLKVTRWARKWDEEGQPYIPFSDYPELSVTTSSVHDSTTLRGWLAGEAREDGELRKVLDVPEGTDLSGSDGVMTVLKALQLSPSLVAAYPIQDLLAVDSEESGLVSDNPEDERINVPGTVQPGNWSWRMKIYLEDLPKQSSLNKKLKMLSSLKKM